LVYLGTTLAFLYLAPPVEAASAATFARSVGQAILGSSGPPALALVVVLSVSASVMALLLMAPRLYLAMSAGGIFPSAGARLGPRTGTPARATVLLAVLASAYVLSGSFQTIVAFFMATTLVFIGLAAGGLFVIRRRGPGSHGFRAPGHPITTALFAGLVGVIVLLIVAARPVPALTGFALVLLGLPLHRLLTRTHPTNG
jgi:APA family basic amino acid/polyamine antiporter